MTGLEHAASGDLSSLRGDSLGVRDGGRTHSWDLSRDVLVVGLGAAGGSPAIEARRAGAEVLVVDRFAGGQRQGLQVRGPGERLHGGRRHLLRARRRTPRGHPRRGTSLTESSARIET